MPTVSSSGRPMVTSRWELEKVAFELFFARGFHQVTVDDIASAAGIGRRTFFRYFPSKNDVVWGDFRLQLDQLEADLGAVGRKVPLPRALIDSIVAFNTYPEDEVASHRRRMELILTVPELQAHSTLQYAAWRRVVAGYVARRTNSQPDDLLPQVVAHTALGAAIAAYENWIRSGSESLEDILRKALTVWAGGLALRNVATG